MVLTKDLGEFRRWAQAVANGEIRPTPDAVVRICLELLDEIDHLHNRYAHEGGTPQVLTVDILIEWIGALSVPLMEDVYIGRIVNTFRANFAADLEPQHSAQLGALGLVVVETDDYLHGRYLLKWSPPHSDEC